MANAAQTLHLRNGHQVTHLKDLDDLDSALCALSLPELWVVTRDSFVDPSTHSDTLKIKLQEAQAAYRSAKLELQASLEERRQLRKRRADESDETKQNILENQIDTLSMDIDEAKTGLTGLKSSVIACRKAVASSLKAPSAAESAQPSKDIFTRLAKPTRATMRVQARLNGNDKMASQPCLGTTMEELLLSCAKHLRLRVVKKLYTMNGKRLRTLADISQAQEVYASAGEAWVDPAKLAREVQLCHAPLCKDTLTGLQQLQQRE